jgi:hypothetical protein
MTFLNEFFFSVVFGIVSKPIWHHLDFITSDFFNFMDAHEWIKFGSRGSQAFAFFIGVWCRLGDNEI